MLEKKGTVLRFSDIEKSALVALLERYGLMLEIVPSTFPIPGSYWGDDEAGLITNVLYSRQETPIHSILHEACHFICMSPKRRETLHTDAGGSDVEEAGVCFLQILLSEELPGVGQARMFADMDAWGYSFRFGTTERWFLHDAEDAREWLLAHRVINDLGQPCGLNMRPDP